MKKAIAKISIISIVVSSMALAPISSASPMLMGNDAIDRPSIDGYQNFTIVDTNNPAPFKAELDSFSYFARNNNPFRFVIVDAGNEVQWVSEAITPEIFPGVNTISVSAVIVEAGWNIGMYFSMSGTIPYELNGAADPAWYESNNAGLPVVGEVLSYQGSSNRIYSFSASGVRLPYGEIISPEVGAEVFGTLNLEAVYVDGDAINDDNVKWAVRKGTCAAGTGTVWGNVDGKNNAPTWDGQNFTAVLDATAAEAGIYCFVFNPTDDAGENNVRETREFSIGNLSVTPVEAYNMIGTEHLVTADIGLLVGGIELLFEVTGANPMSGSAMTDDSGLATFTYTGVVAGADTITVCVDTDNDGVCGSGEESASANKYWSDEYIAGGGQLIEEVGSKMKDWLKISFGGGVFRYDGNLYGDLDVVFHNTSNDTIDKATFIASGVESMNFYNPDSDTCDAAANFTVMGELNGVPGYRLTLRAGDANAPGHFTAEAFDTVRIELFSGNTKIYETNAGDFESQSSCRGDVRTGLDNGNITISR